MDDNIGNPERVALQERIVELKMEHRDLTRRSNVSRPTRRMTSCRFGASSAANCRSKTRSRGWNGRSIRTCWPRNRPRFATPERARTCHRSGRCRLPRCNLHTPLR